MTSVPPSDVFVLSSFVTPIVHALRASCSDADERLRALGLSPSTLDDPSARIPHDKWVALLELGCEVTQDPGFGMTAATMVEGTAMDIGRYLAGENTTMRKVFMQARPYLHAFHGGVKVEIEEDAALTRCSFSFEGLASPPVLMEHIVARAVMLGRRMLGAQYNPPLRIDFRHRRTSELARYESILGAPVRFQAEHDALVFPREHFDLHLSQEVAAADAKSTVAIMPFRLRARAHLLRNLANGDVSLEGAAAHLGLHPRTLRRRLAAEQTSHAEILDSLRQERAIELLTDGTNVATTTLELGFSEPAAFRRAFRRWTGTNPSSFARKQRSATR